MLLDHSANDGPDESPCFRMHDKTFRRDESQYKIKHPVEGTKDTKGELLIMPTERNVSGSAQWPTTQVEKKSSDIAAFARIFKKIRG